MVYDMDHDETPVCLKHGEPLTLWNGHSYCPVCDANDGVFDLFARGERWA